MPAEGINPVELPESVRHVWNWFLQLNDSRDQGFNGPMPITNREMQAFFEIEDIETTGWEPSAIRVLDRVAMKSRTKEKNA